MISREVGCLRRFRRLSIPLTKVRHSCFVCQFLQWLMENILVTFINSHWRRSTREAQYKERTKRLLMCAQKEEKSKTEKMSYHSIIKKKQKREFHNWFYRFHSQVNASKRAQFFNRRFVWLVYSHKYEQKEEENFHAYMFGFL